MSLGVYWDKRLAGRLELAGERSREFTFTYIETDRPISLSLPLSSETFSPMQTRPFFEGLLPEGVVREQIAAQLKLASEDVYGLLAELGQDCAGALQILEGRRMSETPEVRWIEENELAELVEALPRRPLGIRAGEERQRLSLAGVQRKAVLVRDEAGRFGEPLSGMPSTHILKPQFADPDTPGLAVNEFFCLTLADRCGLRTARAELLIVASRPCLLVQRYDRDHRTWPPRRLHQEDLCQALGLSSSFKYQQEDWAIPSFRALAELLDEHGAAPGVDRLDVGRMAVFTFLIANADAHAKNVSLLHEADGVRLAPLYDLVCIGAYPAFNQRLALAIGEELDPERVGAAQWSDLAVDLGLQPRGFLRDRDRLAASAVGAARGLLEESRREGWYEPILDQVVAEIEHRAGQIG